MVKTNSREQIFVKIYVSAEEKAGICAATASSGLSLSEYARSKLMGPGRRAGPGKKAQSGAPDGAEDAPGGGDEEADAGERRTRRADVYLTPGEYGYAVETAARLRLSVSEFMRRTTMHTPLPSPADFAARDAVRDLMKVNADQARLGNSLRQKIDILGASAVSREWLEDTAALEREIRENQGLMKALAVEISEAVKAGTVP